MAISLAMQPGYRRKAHSAQRRALPCGSYYVQQTNILIDNQGSVTGIVDFDRALWGDVEIEFAVLDYCGISEPAF